MNNTQREWEGDFRRLWHHGMAVDDIGMTIFIRTIEDKARAEGAAAEREKTLRLIRAALSYSNNAKETIKEIDRLLTPTKDKGEDVRGDLAALGDLSDREFRYYIMSLGICVWDRRNQLAGTFDARTDVVKQNMLPKWSTGKINMTKNSLLRRGLYKKTDDIRRLKIADIQKLENAPKKVVTTNHYGKHNQLF